MTDTPATPAVPALPVAITLQADVKAAIGTRNTEVRTRVVNDLVEQEIAARAALLSKALVVRRDQANDVKKAEKPDQVSYDAEGKVVTQSFSKAGADALKKAKEKLAKTDKAIAKAVDEADYEGLKNLGKSDSPEKSDEK